MRFYDHYERARRSEQVRSPTSARRRPRFRTVTWDDGRPVDAGLVVSLGVAKRKSPIAAIASGIRSDGQIGPSMGSLLRACRRLREVVHSCADGEGAVGRRAVSEELG